MFSICSHLIYLPNLPACDRYFVNKLGAVAWSIVANFPNIIITFDYIIYKMKTSPFASNLRTSSFRFVGAHMPLDLPLILLPRLLAHNLPNRLKRRHLLLRLRPRKPAVLLHLVALQQKLARERRPAHVASRQRFVSVVAQL